MYIQALSCITPQNTYNDILFEGGIRVHTGNQYKATEPRYSGIIPLNLLRRMGKAVRMGVGTGLKLMQDHKDLDGILIGSANGSLENCIKFLNQVIRFDEQTLTPTNFVQSTPNSIAGHLALMGSVTGYNTTHVGVGFAFESSLLDAQMLFEEGRVKKLLIGGVEEISEYNYNVDSASGMFKEEEIDSTQLIGSGTKGTVSGEGSVMFILSDSKENALAQVVDSAQISFPTKEELLDRAKTFLDKQGLLPSDIEHLVLGYNGDGRSDFWYQHLSDSLFSNQGLSVYKNLVGDYYTSTAFATWLATQILQGYPLPEETIYRKGKELPKNVLIYNHWMGKQHSFILLRGV